MTKREMTDALFDAVVARADARENGGRHDALADLEAAQAELQRERDEARAEVERLQRRLTEDGDIEGQAQAWRAVCDALAIRAGHGKAMDAAVREVERLLAEVAAQARELERWRHGGPVAWRVRLKTGNGFALYEATLRECVELLRQSGYVVDPLYSPSPVEGDFVCPDSVALDEALAEVERLRATVAERDAEIERRKSVTDAGLRVASIEREELEDLRRRENIWLENSERASRSAGKRANESMPGAVERMHAELYCALAEVERLRALLPEAWDAGAARAIGSHELFQQTHLTREEWLAARGAREEHGR